MGLSHTSTHALAAPATQLSSPCCSKAGPNSPLAWVQLGWVGGDTIGDEPPIRRQVDLGELSKPGTVVQHYALMGETSSHRPGTIAMGSVCW